MHHCKHSEATKRRIGNAIRGKHHSRKTRRKISRAMKRSQKGCGNNNWKGGRVIDPVGYMKIYVLNRGYVYEHRFVIEQYLGRRLKSKEHVHHIDGNKLNNKIKNLIVFKSYSSHRRFHANSKNIKKEEIILDGRKV